MLTTIEQLEALCSQPHERALRKEIRALLIDVDPAYFHSSKALVRSKMWDPTQHVERSRLPSAGEIHRCIDGAGFDAATYDRERAERIRTTLY